MNILFLDDDRARHRLAFQLLPVRETWFTREAGITIDILKSQAPAWDVVFLDHDLSGEVMVNSDRRDCGMEVVRWIEKAKPQIRVIFCHSHNKERGPVMAERLRAAGYPAAWVPFGGWLQAGLKIAADPELRETLRTPAVSWAWDLIDRLTSEGE